MKTAAELIVHAAIRHLRARIANHVERVGVASARIGAQKELERHCWWKLRRAAKTAVYRIVISDHAGVSGVKQLRIDRMIRTASFTQAAQLSNQRRTRFADLVWTLFVSVSNTEQDTRKSRNVVAILRREICAAVKRYRIGSAESPHRPASMMRHHLHGVHVDLIEIRPLFTI